MKAFILLALVACSASAQVQIENVPLGSGQGPVQKLDNNLFFSPQYMPGFPTSATIFPRIIEVPCYRDGNVIKCEGYQWSPKLGRGEYLYFTPRMIDQKK